MSTRLLAWEVLRSHSEMPMRRARAAARRAGIERRDRALLYAILGTAIRRRGTLQALVRALAHRHLDPDLSAHVHVGLVQLLFLDHVPDHAAVDEAVRAAQTTLGPRAGRTTNAILRELLRRRVEGPSGDPRRDLPFSRWHLERAVFADPSVHPLLWAEEALSMPVVLVRRWTKRYGQATALELARRALVEPDLSVRVVRPNAMDARASDSAMEPTGVSDSAMLPAGTSDSGLDPSREGIARALRALGCEPRDARHPDVLLLPHGDAERVIASELFARGAITIQGETALRSAELVGALAGERILDLCAAPGGKTAVLASAGASVVAHDKSAARLLALRETIARLHPAGSVEVLDPERAESLEAMSFDAVLVDAPCSNTGVLAQRPGARWRFSASASRSLEAVQTELLERGASCVRPGGRLVYSTCSIEPDENRRRVDAFLGRHLEFELGEALEALPNEADAAGPVDGGYAARLSRKHG